MKSSLVLLNVVINLHLAFAATHSLAYFYTAVSRDVPSDFPEFTVVGLVDGGPFVYFDSNTMQMVPKTEWMRESEKEDYWDQETYTSKGLQLTFKDNLQVAKKRFNETQLAGLHTYQAIRGCEWDEETGDMCGFERNGYDGEDFLVLDLENLSWVAPVQQAVITKRKWDKDLEVLQFDKKYYTKECVHWLKTYVAYGRSSLERKVSPEVSLLQKEPSSPVTCHATGFYPSGVMLTWQKDGEEMHEDVELGETLPNQDRTFQKRSTLKVSPDDLNKHKFSCVVDHQSLKERMVKDWEPKSNLGIIIACVVVVGLVAVFIAVVFVVMKRRNADRANNDKGSSNGDTNSDNSESVALKSPGQTTDEH